MGWAVFNKKVGGAGSAYLGMRSPWFTSRGSSTRHALDRSTPGTSSSSQPFPVQEAAHLSGLSDHLESIHLRAIENYKHLPKLYNRNPL